MTRHISTKKELLVSVIALIVCFSMLVGGTFAWFTDTATTGVNKIQAGNLDVALYKGDVKDGAISYTEVIDEKTLMFNNEALWEPGYTEVAYIKIDNVGTLALKALLTVNFAKQVAGTSIEGNEVKLSNYLMYDLIQINEGDFYATREDARAAAKEGAKLIATEQNEIKLGADDDAKYYALVVYMPEDVANEANYRGDAIPSIELCITLIATQDTVENDSWDNLYDNDSQYPSSIKNNEGLYEALQSSDNVTIKNGNYELPLGIPAGKTVNVEGGDFAVSGEQGAAFTVGKDANLTISTSNVVVKDYNIAVDVNEGGALTINAGTYASSDIQVIHIKGNSEATVTINDGSIKGTAGIWVDNSNSVIKINGGNFKVWALVAGDFPSDTPITVTGGTFDLGSGGLAASQNHSLNISGGTFDFEGSSFGVLSNTLVITGGTFNLDPTQYVDTAAYNVNLVDGWYTVVAK